MSDIAGVQLRNVSKILFCEIKDESINENDLVVVETEHGLEIAKVIVLNVMNRQPNNLLINFIRKCNKKDIDNYEKNIKDSMNALNNAKRIANKYKLNMKFVNSDFNLDRTQLYFNFVSDNRVDFRDLAKDLAAIYKTRIELRQIGARDKAKSISGIGQCGRELCCSCYLDDIDSVSINMAKNQNLSLNPNKINGQCGRLLCCLKFEDDVYSEYRCELPNVGDIVKTEKGEGKVVSIDILNKKIYVNIPDEGKIEIEMKDCSYGECCK